MIWFLINKWLLNAFPELMNIFWMYLTRLKNDRKQESHIININSSPRLRTILFNHKLRTFCQITNVKHTTSTHPMKNDTPLIIEFIPCPNFSSPLLAIYPKRNDTNLQPTHSENIANESPENIRLTLSFLHHLIQQPLPESSPLISL